MVNFKNMYTIFGLPLRRSFVRKQEKCCFTCVFVPVSVAHNTTKCAASCHTYRLVSEKNI